jgi:hypothetical protein
MEYIKTIKSNIKKNIFYVVISIAILLIILLTYKFSRKKRINDKLKYINNTLTYDKPRLQIDFCGVDNSLKDNFISKLIFDHNENSIELYENNNIDLYDLGLSSEFYVTLENTLESDNTSKYYKIEKVMSSKKLKFRRGENDAHIHEDEQKNQVTAQSEKTIKVSYFRPSSNINSYKNKKLTDYFVCSSYRSFLIGNQLFDYCSIEMLKRVLYFGARYIELEIFDKENKDNTEPIISAGFEHTHYKTTLDYLSVTECIMTIAKFAFSDKFLENYNDPLFLFLNIKTDNFETLDKVYDDINTYLHRYLLPKKYNHYNISNLTLCELKRKCVILSNGKYKRKIIPTLKNNNSNTDYIYSKLNNIINCSTDKPYLKRLYYSEINKPANIYKTAKFQLQSNLISFKNDINDYIEINDYNINLNSTLNKGDYLQIDNALNPINNTGESMYKITQITKNKIVFDKSVKFNNETSGKYVNLIGYDKNINSENIEEFNKNGLTIVIPDIKLFSRNYNYKNALYKGCQFVTMNFQNIDNYMKNYFNYFIKKSFINKPSQLLNFIDTPKSQSLNSLVPKFESDIVLDIDYDFKTNIEYNVSPYFNNSMRMINDNRVLRLSKNFDNSNNKFEIVPPLNGKSGHISIKSKDRYLCVNNNCCYLFFTKKVPDGEFNEQLYEYKNNASFIILNPLIRKKGYNSIGYIRESGLNLKQELYYLKYRNYLNPKYKLYYKNQTYYKIIAILENNEDTKVCILRAHKDKKTGFNSCGDIVVPLNNVNKINDSLDIVNPNQSFSTPIVGGAVDKPIDYELVWDNKLINDIPTSNEDFSIWKPIANDGFVGIGVIFKIGYRKPLLDDMVCVSVDYVKDTEFTIVPPPWYNKAAKLILWKNNDNNFVKPDTFIPKNIKDITEDMIPNPIDFQSYKLILDEKDYSDRLYLDKNMVDKDTKMTTLFKFVSYKRKETGGGQIYDYLLKLKNKDGKLKSYTRNKNGGDMCLALPQHYWTDYYKQVTNDIDQPEQNERQTIQTLELNNEVDGLLEINNCNTRDYFGTNWQYNIDKSIRLEGNPNYCITHNNNKNIKDSNNKIYLSECSSDLFNQKYVIENNNIKVFNPDNDINACVTHGLDNIVQLDECGNDKFTTIYKWDGGLYRDDNCDLKSAKTKLKDIGSMEICEDNSYYLIYTDGLVKHKEECSKDDILETLKELQKEKTYIYSIFHRGFVLKNNLNKISDINDVIKNEYMDYYETLIYKYKKCLKCKYSSKTICKNNTFYKTNDDYFENEKTKMELSDYCLNLKDDSSFKCDKTYRQKFTNTLLKPNYCLGNYKEVYIYFNSPNHHTGLNQNLSINVSRKDEIALSNNIITPVDNLLGEHYDDNYHIFIKGIISLDSSDSSDNYYNIIFNNIYDSTSSQSIGPIKILKISNDIILHYLSDYNDYKIGDKVLARLEYEGTEPEKIADDNEKNIAFNNDGNKMTGKYVKWMAVVVKKYDKTKELKIMFSINSYESNILRKDTYTEGDTESEKNKNRPFKTINPTKITSYLSVVKLRKAPFCFQ